MCAKSDFLAEIVDNSLLNIKRVVSSCYALARPRDLVTLISIHDRRHLWRRGGNHIEINIYILETNKLNNGDCQEVVGPQAVPDWRKMAPRLLAALPSIMKRALHLTSKHKIVVNFYLNFVFASRGYRCDAMMIRNRLMLVGKVLIDPLRVIDKRS